MPKRLILFCLLLFVSTPSLALTTICSVNGAPKTENVQKAFRSMELLSISVDLFKCTRIKLKRLEVSYSTGNTLRDFLILSKTTLENAFIHKLKIQIDYEEDQLSSIEGSEPGYILSNPTSLKLIR